MNKEELIKRFKSISSMQRQKLISKKMKAKGIKASNRIPNIKYYSSDVYELIQIANCFPELREND